MIARGDLALEIETVDLPSKSKEITEKCNLRAKPVIMATQMLEGMKNNVECSRPEASDVFTAVVDGADALLLSGETSSGRYPVQAIRKMEQLAIRAEKYVESRFASEEEQIARRRLETMTKRVQNLTDHWAEILAHYGRGTLNGSIRRDEHDFIQKLVHVKYDRVANQSSTDSISHAACIMSADERVFAILAPTTSGRTGRMLTRFRPRAWIITQPHTDLTARKLALQRGVLINQIVRVDRENDSVVSLRKKVEKTVRASETLRENNYIFICGMPLGNVGATNVIYRLDLARPSRPQG